MDRRSVVIGSIGGIAVTALVLVAFPPLNWSAEKHRVLFDMASFRIDLLWFAFLGAALGAAIIMSKRYPLLVAVPALLLGYLHFVTFKGSGPLVDWVPGSIILRFLRSISMTALLLVGVFAATAAWHLWQSNRDPSLRSAAPIAGRHQALSAVAGVAIVIALLPLLQRLWIAYFTQARIGESAGARRAMLGLFVVGAVLAALIAVSKRLPLLAVSAAAALTLYLILNPLFGIMPFDGIAGFDFRFALFVPPDLAVIAGLLAAVAVWRVIESHRAAETDRVFSVGGVRGEGLSPITR